jgi:hypothetical protein
VLSSFLHQRSNDQQHPQTRRIEEFFLKFVQSFNPATKVIPFTSVDETELSEFQYLCECSYVAQRDNFIQEVSKVVYEAIQDEEVAPHSSRCLFLLKIGSASTEKTDPSYALPLSIPVTSSFVLQVAAAIYHLASGNSVDTHNRLVATVCRSSLHCGGYYIVTTVDNTCTIKLLDPKDGSTDLLPRKLKHARRDYIIKELIFIQTDSQSYDKPKFALQEEIIWGTMLKPAVLRNFLLCNDLIDNEILDPVIDLVRQSIHRQPRAGDNILLPALFYQVVVIGCDTLGAALSCEESLRISKYDWNVESTVVHLLLNHPFEHWQYCTIVFETKMIVFNDSFSTYTNEKDPDRSAVWEHLKKFLNFVYEHLNLTFEEASWNKTVWDVPQQKERGGKVNCAVYSIVFLLYGVIQGLSGSSFEETQRWMTVKGEKVSNFIPAFVKSLKNLICGAILRESEIFDILFLFVPPDNLSTQRKQYWAWLKSTYDPHMEFKVLNVNSINFLD